MPFGSRMIISVFDTRHRDSEFEPSSGREVLPDSRRRNSTRYDENRTSVVESLASDAANPSSRRRSVYETSTKHDYRRSTAQDDPRVEKLTKEIGSLKKDNKSLVKGLESLRREHESLIAKLETLESKNVSLKEDKESLRRQNNKQRVEIEQLRGANSTLETQARQADARHTDETKLLSSRVAELETALPFFSTIHSISGAELEGKVESLNAEITRQATAISDSVVGRHERDFVDDETDKNWTKMLIEEGVLDPSMVNVIRSPHLKSFHVRMALKAAMVHAAHQVITTLDPDHQPSITKLCSDIDHAERYPIFAKWRAITHAQLSRTTDYKTPSARLFESFVMAVLTVAGWDDQVKGLNLRGRLHELVDAAMELNKIFMQDTHTTQLKFLAFSSSTRFHPLMMDDEAEVKDLTSRQVRINQHVLCTTSLGSAFSLVDPQDLDGLDPRWEYPLKAGVITPRKFSHLSGHR